MNGSAQSTGRKAAPSLPGRPGYVFTPSPWPSPPQARERELSWRAPSPWSSCPQVGGRQKQGPLLTGGAQRERTGPASSPVNESSGVRQSEARTLHWATQARLAG